MQNHLGLTGLAALSALWTGVKAAGQLSPLGEMRHRRVFFLGRIAGRTHFTDVGWRYKQISFVLQLIAVLLAVA